MGKSSGLRAHLCFVRLIVPPLGSDLTVDAERTRARLKLINRRRSLVSAAFFPSVRRNSRISCLFSDEGAFCLKRKV